MLSQKTITAKFKALVNAVLEDHHPPEDVSFLMWSEGPSIPVNLQELDDTLVFVDARFVQLEGLHNLVEQHAELFRRHAFVAILSDEQRTWLPKLIRHGYFDAVIYDRNIQSDLIRTVHQFTIRKRNRNIHKAFNDAQRIAKLGSWKFDAATKSFELSKEAKRIMNVQPDELISRESLLSRVPKSELEIIERIREGLRVGKPVEFEHKLVVNGELKWVLSNISPIVVGGEMTGAEGTILDITSRKMAELKLEEREERFRNLIEKNSDVVVVEDEYSVIQYVSPAVTDMLGYEEDELLGADKTALIHPDEIAIRNQAFEEILSGKITSKKLKLRIKQKSGEYTWVLATFSDQRKVKGINGIVVNVKDIDSEERIQQELKVSNERFEFATEATKDVIWEWDLIRNSISYGKSFERVFGHRVKGIDSLKEHPFIHPMDKESVIDSVRNAVFSRSDSYWTAEYRFKRSDGTYAWVLDNATILRDASGKAYRVLGAISDITERVQYERSIEEQNAKLRDIAWMQSHLVRAPLANLMGLIDILMHAEEFERDEIERRIYASSEELDGVIRNIVKNSERFTSDEAAVSTWRYNALSEDITELYLHPDLMDNSNQPYAITNKFHKVVYVNPAFEQMSGFDFESIHGQSISEVMAGPSTQREILRYIEAQEAVRHPFEVELIVYSSEKNPFWIRVTAQPFISAEGVFSGFFHTITDINDAKHAEEIILEKTKHLAQINEDLKQFTYTISHDLKAPANSLKGLLELLEMESKTEMNDQSGQYITRALQSVERLRDMIEALLVYSRSGVVSEELKKVRVNDLINSAKDTIVDQIREHNVTIDIEDNDMEINVYPLLFSRVVQNLMHNSIKFRSSEPPSIKISVMDEDRHWTFTIADNGIGIEEDDLEQIFDLFYYKSEHQSPDSHGIGLAIVKRAIEQHHGEVNVESTVGKGTTFTFSISKSLGTLV